MNKILKYFFKSGGYAILIFFVLIFGFLVVNMTAGDDINKLIVQSAVIQNFKSNDLSFEYLIPKNDLSIKTISIDNFFKKDLDSFREWYYSNYVYTSQYDCKFNAMVWTRYFFQNNISSYDYIQTDNHIFVIYYFDEGYCLFDTSYSRCYGGGYKNEIKRTN